jgi:zinc D-Ala-D-Ala carboxypeptidase
MTGMKYLGFSIVLAALIGVIVLQTQTSRGQEAKGSAKEQLLKPTSAVREAPTAFHVAAVRNTALRYELDWTFGGKPQRGWYLYKGLIGRLLDTDADVMSDDFAVALSRWQQTAGLPPSGILDADTLYAMIAKWQSERLKDRSFAASDQLVLAPSSEFWDPERLEELRQVERETYAAYHRMLAAAVADPSLGLALDADGKLAPTEKYLKLLSTFRTREYQEKLRRETPAAGRAGLAINSPHFTGRAIDIYVGGDPVETKDFNRAIQVETKVYKWLVRNAGSFGFRPYFYEPWHWEYVGTNSNSQ